MPWDLTPRLTALDSDHGDAGDKKQPMTRRESFNETNATGSRRARLKITQGRSEAECGGEERGIISYQISEIRKQTRDFGGDPWGFAMGGGFLTSRTPFGMTVFGLLQKSGRGIKKFRGFVARRRAMRARARKCDRNCEKLGRLR